MAEENTEQNGVGLPPGTEIGKYKIVERARIGGQAIIYRAHEPLLDRDVAIKQISSHLAEDAVFLDRFRREARILAKLGQEQPAIVTIHELIEHERGLFIVMEWVEGHTLEEVLAEQPEGIEVKAALQIIWRLAAALHTVHAEGIVHRDIKPANIIIGEHLRVKIADFGVAASKSGNTSMLLGTTKYMAPELLSGGVSGDQVDMYSLGFVAYEILAGRRRFREVFSDVIRDKHAESFLWMKWHADAHVSAPLLHEVNPAVPEALSEIVAKMMAKDPDQRYASMEELGRAIRSKFSPKARAESVGAVTAPSSVDEDEVIGTVRGVPEPDDQAAEAEGAEGPATATLPRTALTLRTKLILAGAVFVGIVAVAILLAVQSAMKTKRLQTSAQTALKNAETLYKNYDYTGALPQFEQLQKDYPHTTQAAQASVYVPMCKGYLAVEAHKFDEAGQHEEAARDQCLKVQSRFPSLVEWTRTFKDQHIDGLAGTRMDAKDFLRRAVSARRSLEDGNFAEVQRELKEMDDLRHLTKKLQQELKQLRSDLELARFRHGVNAVITQGRSLGTKGELENAKAAYERAVAMLDSRSADVLPAAERDALKRDLQKRIRSLASQVSYEETVQAVKEAKGEGDREAEMVALQKAIAMRRDEPRTQEFESRLAALRIEIDLEIAKKHIDQRNDGEAILVLQGVLRRDPNNAKASGLLKGLHRQVKLREVQREADRLFSDGKWAAAIPKYQEALRLQPSEFVTGRITDCKFNIQFAEAERLEKAGRMVEAIAAYEKAKAISSRSDALIEARQQAMRRELDYRELMAQGDQALAAKRWNRALSLYGKAKRVKNTGEVNLRITRTKYERFVSFGDEAMAKRDFKGAKAHYLLAKGVMETPEIKKKIADAQAFIDAQEGKD